MAALLLACFLRSFIIVFLFVLLQQFLLVFQIYMLVALFIFPFLKERTLNSSLLRTFFFFFLFP